MTLSYDPLDEAFLANPYPTYALLRDQDPVHHHAATDEVPELWALSRFADIWESVRTPGDFSSAQGLTFYPDEIGQLGLPPNLVMLDPPVQTRLRALIGRGFTPKRVEQLEGTIREFVRRQLLSIGERAGEGERVDLHQEFSSTIPTFMLAELFGVAEEDRLRFGPWVHALTAIQNDGFRIGQLDGKGAVAELLTYFTEQIASRRQSPSDDLLGSLVAAELDGERLSDWDILGFCFVVVAGGSDTTASLISHGIALLSERPDQRELLVKDPTLISNALIEFLRLESSVQGLCRTTTRDVTLHDTTIPAGQKVMMLYGSANRDPREFGDSADVLDVRRTIPRHLAFSSGPHFCIGSHLARLQAKIAFEELLALHPHVSVDTAAGERHRSPFVRGWVSLPAGNFSTPDGPAAG
ncbi:MAG: cytochrome P450 [Nocardioides sp.]|nr:cytochrome P450 [Nocardioides sp.]